MHIITHTCPRCGTVVSANFLEEERITKCPRSGCEEVLSFEDLPEGEQAYFLEHIDEYQI
jgi:predicted  nucleic acid-binding Zn-ribbon protein